MYLWFLFVMTCLCGVVTWLSLVALYYILAVMMYNMPAALEEAQIVLLHSRYHGFHGLILGFTMILKQQIPDEFPINFIPIRAKNIPFIALMISVALSFLTNQVSDLPFIIFGFYISWLYLRFYQTTQDGTKGDHSDSFAFHTLFPHFLHPLLEPLGTKIYNVSRQLKIVSEIRTIQTPQPTFTNKVSLSSNFDSIFLDSPIKPSAQSSTSSQAASLVDQHLTAPKTSEQSAKRRELALQELDKKLQSSTNASSNKVDKSENV
nr:unnamed protein product [Naegleria fowleri]